MYDYGRIQLTVPKQWVGCTAWVYVGVPLKPLTQEEAKLINWVQKTASKKSQETHETK